MLTQEELIRFEVMIVEGTERSDPVVLSAADQMMDAMMNQANMVASVNEAADRDRAFQEGMQRAMQDARDQGARDAAARDAAARDAAARDAAARDAAARDAAREHVHEAARERQVADHNERNIAAADRIHEARAMQGGLDFKESLPKYWTLADLRNMPFSELIAAREEALGLHYGE